MDILLPYLAIFLPVPFQKLILIFPAQYQVKWFQNKNWRPYILALSVISGLKCLLFFILILEYKRLLVALSETPSGNFSTPHKQYNGSQLAQRWALRKYPTVALGQLCTVVFAKLVYWMCRLKEFLFFKDWLSDFPLIININNFM